MYMELLDIKNVDLLNYIRNQIGWNRIDSCEIRVMVNVFINNKKGNIS